MSKKKKKKLPVAKTPKEKFIKGKNTVIKQDFGAEIYERSALIAKTNFERLNYSIRRTKHLWKQTFQSTARTTKTNPNSLKIPHPHLHIHSK